MRTEVDEASEPLNGRIRRARLQRIPYVLVVGDDDVAAGTVGVNARGGDRPVRGVALEEFAERLAAEIAERSRPEASVSPSRGAHEPRTALERAGAPGTSASVTSPESRRTASGAEARRRPRPTSDRPISDGDAECVFCRIIASSGDDEARLVVASTSETIAIMNAYPYASGHLLVMPVRHVSELGELTASESAGLWSMTTDAVTAIEAAYLPDGMNIGANLGRAAGAGIPRHLHLHVVPRWIGDTNFMTTIASVRIMPEALTVSWSKSSPASWPK